VLNLVTNAVEAAEESAAPEVHVSVEATNEAVLIRVADNGPGIAPELIGRLFTPFVSGKGGRGTGLGLAVVRKIAREHGGDVAVRSEPGAGATFELTLPVAPPQDR
jgi:signal transduction histidine kinase